MVLDINFDLGNSVVKVCCNDRLFMYESRVSQVESIWGKHDMILEHNDEKFLIGKGEFEIENSKFMKRNTLPLIMTGIAIAMGDLRQVAVNASFGLPIGQYQEFKEVFRQMIEENKVLNFTFNGIGRKVILDRVFIFPEGFGAFIALGHKKGIMIDIGSKTTDMFLFNKEIKTPLSIYKGVLDIYNSIAQALTTKYRCNFTLEEIPEILEDGYYEYGTKQNIEDCLEEAKSIVNEIYTTLKMNYDINKFPVFLTGGGSQFLAEKIRERIPNLISYDDLYLNVKGYSKLLRARLSE